MSDRWFERSLLGLMFCCVAIIALCAYSAITAPPTRFVVQTTYTYMADSVVKVELPSGGYGSGWAVSPNRIMTAWHVMEGEDPAKVVVLTRDGRKLKVLSIVKEGKEPSFDWALVEVEEHGLPVPPIDCVFDGLNSQGTSVGLVGMLGSPFKSSWAVLYGYIVGLVVIEEGELPFLSMALPAMPGVSGAPVFDTRGKVIGMITRAATRQSFGFAVPSERVCTAFK